MKKIINILLFNLLLFSCKGQGNDNKQSQKPTNKMNTDTINLTPNISLFQVKNSLENPERTNWELYLKNKKEDKRILLDSLSITHPGPNDIVIADNSVLDIPKLLLGFIDNGNLYVFIFKERALWIYKYIFKEDYTFEYKRIKIFNMLPGSVPNFGDASFIIIPYKIDTKNYFYISHNRVIGEIKMMVKLDANLFKINKLIFSEPSKKIKDEQQVFKTLDLEQNKEKVSEEITKVLKQNNLLKQYDKFSYIGEIDLSYFKGLGRRTSNLTYFFYEDYHLKTKIICYDNDNNEWLIGDYKEEEIKQE
jgi:hypothetical protein